MPPAARAGAASVRRPPGQAGSGSRLGAPLLRATGVLALCTLVGEALWRFVEPANVIMVYLAGLVFVALRLGRAAALCTIGGSLFLFDLLYVEPRWSLKPTDPQYFLTFAVMVGVGLVISHLAERAREQARHAEARATRNQALNRMALQLARASDADAVGQALDDAVREALGAGARLVDAEEATRAAADPGCRVLPLDASRAAPGAVVLGGLGEAALSADDEQLLRSFASQAAIALERVRYQHLSAEAAMTADRERLRNTLLAGISHDVRTPLTTIIGAASSLLEQDAHFDAGRRRALQQQVLDESQRLHALVSDLLDVTRLEAGAVRADCEWCPLDELVQEAWQGLGPRSAGHALELEVPDELSLWCDPRLLGQALGNLLDNARRHSPAGAAVTVRARHDGHAVHVAVLDRGPGLAPGHEQRVFEKFFRSGDGGGADGTGLGLAICAAVAELHGGTIGARNDGGACFELRLPQPGHAPPAIDDERDPG